MKSTQYIAATLSAFVLFDGVVAQRGGGRGQGDEGNSQSGQSTQASTTAAAAATTTTTVAAAGGQNQAAVTTTTTAAAAAGGGKDKAAATSTTAAAAATTTSAAANNNNAANAAGGNNGATTLNPNVIAKGSESNGNPSAGQAPSLTDNANFINFCAGQAITNGEQNQGGSCNPIPMGQLPAKGKMVSTIITQPQNGANLGANQQFTVELQTQNMILGSFTNPNNTYYAAPQQIRDGNIVGHAHVTIQDMGDNKTPPDPTKFAFFKGIDDAGNGQGLVSVAVPTGLPNGNYRICTLMSSSNHQAVLMPVAQRGAQDDCIRITVGQGGANAQNNGAQGNNAAATTTSAAAKGGASTSAAAAGGATTTTSQAANQATPTPQNNNNNNRGQGGGNRNARGRFRRDGSEMRFVERELIV